MAPVHKIALVQLSPKPLDPAENFAKASEFIRSAARQGCTLAVLPEYHLTSWVPDDPAFRTTCIASAAPYLDKYKELARETGMCIVPGTIVEPSSTSSSSDEQQQQNEEEITLNNVCYFLSPTGDILGRYTKKNLWALERRHLVSSAHEPHSAFDTPLGRVGLLVCWDLAFPEGFRELISDGAQLLIVPAFWTLKDVNAEGAALNPEGEEVFLNSTVVARAFENTCAVIFVNAGGPVHRGQKTNFAGVSQVGMPHLGSVGRMNRSEGMQIVDVDMDVLRIAEENYQVRADMKTEGWHYAYTRVREGKL